LIHSHFSSWFLFLSISISPHLSIFRFFFSFFSLIFSF
jgi:hypothetical protein